jgi:hypothetical protein
VPDATGRIVRATVVRDQTTPELRRAAFESCVVGEAKQQSLGPRRDEDVEIDVPLTFEPIP